MLEEDNRFITSFSGSSLEGPRDGEEGWRCSFRGDGSSHEGEEGGLAEDPRRPCNAMASANTRHTRHKGG